MHPIQVKGTIQHIQIQGHTHKKRVTATLKDHTGEAQLIWFKKIYAIQQLLKNNHTYLLFGQPQKKNNTTSFIHPHIQRINPQYEPTSQILPLFPIPTKYQRKGLHNTSLQQLQKEALTLTQNHIHEILPDSLQQTYQLITKQKALAYIHFPPNKKKLAQARYRLKFEELLLHQLTNLFTKNIKKKASHGYIFNDTSLLTQYYNDHLPFALTKDQKKAIKTLYQDMQSGHQMNRLLQGDVGSGKTIVAFIASLLAIAKKTQVALIAPTEVLAAQHYHSLTTQSQSLPINIALLTGSTPTKERKKITQALHEGSLNMIIGTHALLQDNLQYHRLGLAIIDEQHRFGVAQRAKIWHKNKETPPHILIMTATPIPRTLAISLYGDLDITTLKEKPHNRKKIITSHYQDKNRLQIFQQIKKQISQGHQAYIIYPRITTSHQKARYKDLMDGYESITRAFPSTAISLLHGKMKPENKTYEMKRFRKGETKIMIGTTILEVGLDVPNATLIVIENADTFGLATLHQLRGRVGRSNLQSYCLLITHNNLSKKAEARIKTVLNTDNGFNLAHQDLTTRGPGNRYGLQQSGHDTFKLSTLSRDYTLLTTTQKAAQNIMHEDPMLTQKKYAYLKKIITESIQNLAWYAIS